ncbi:MAG: hypothetical protein GY810_06790 [Aureispira sp.]|nr:hypothetical protein [Aureispira sp.]
MRIGTLLLLILLSAIAANALWVFEILYIIGWSGTRWVYIDFYYSTLIINFLVVNAFLMPLCVGTKHKKNYWKLMIGLYLVSIFAFYMAKPLFLSFFMPFFFHIFLVGMVCFFYYIFTYYLLEKLSFWFILALFISIVAVVFESEFISQNFAIYGPTGNFADATKMGYPFFFITINMGLLGIMTRHWGIKEKQIPVLDDVLDDGLI